MRSVVENMKIYEADVNYFNGIVYQMTQENEYRTAFSVRDGKIIAIGFDEEIKSIRAREQIDLQGRVVLPGMIDCHQHTFHYAEKLSEADLKKCESVEQVKEQLRITKSKNQLNDEDWLLGFGFDEQKFKEKTLPTAEDLDEVSRIQPVIITRYCMHICVVNSKVLELAGITDCKDGVVRETRMEQIVKMIPDKCPDKNSKKEILYRALKQMSSCGLTGIHPIQGKFVGAMEYANLYQELYEENRLPVRVYLNFDEFPSFNMKTGFGNDFVKYGFFKIYSDGSLGTRDAALTKPYSDAPGECGILNYSKESITELCKKAYDCDLQIGIHAIGDKGIEIAVDAMESCYLENPKPDIRFRLIHGTVMRQDLIERIKKLPVIVDIQPGYTSNTNIWWSIDRLGEERLKLSYAWNTLRKNHIMLTASSDAPVEPVDPFWGIYSVVMRQDGNELPEGGWQPQERLSVYDAVCMYTKNAAYSSYEEKIKGTLEVGKLADFIVIDRDIFHIPGREIKEIKVLATYVNGQCVYNAKEEI